MSIRAVLSLLVPLLIASGLTWGGCRAEPVSAPVDEPITGDAQQSPSPAQEQAPVARIVFIGQEKACKCARARIDATWTALQEALEGRPPIPVEQITMDQDEDQFDRYDEMQSLIVPPGIYFLDADDQLISVLQGEQTKQQILAVLDPGGAGSTE